MIVSRHQVIVCALHAGLLGGVLICLIIAAVELFTLRVLMRQSTKHRSITYQGLVRLLLQHANDELNDWCRIMPTTPLYSVSHVLREVF
jgi:hypothetical protein